MTFWYALSDVRINRQCQFSGYLPVRKEGHNPHKHARAHTPARQLYLWTGSKKICDLHLPPWWPCLDDGIFEVGEAASQPVH